MRVTKQKTLYIKNRDQKIQKGEILYGLRKRKGREVGEVNVTRNN